jgi:hypothetical protein
MKISFAAWIIAGFLSATAFGQQSQNYLADNTVLIVRHAEKPEIGVGLTAQGKARSRLYIKYFSPFHEGNLNLPIDSLYAGADSKNSIRPRLTLEPLSKSSGLLLHTDISTKDPQGLVSELERQPHGHHPLIAWRHGAIPDLLSAFGADPEKLLPNGKWPDAVYDWVIVLHLDAHGKLISQQLIHEHLQVPTAEQAQQQEQQQEQQ